VGPNNTLITDERCLIDYVVGSVPHLEPYYAKYFGE
jgi:hypothetical protein